MGESSPTGYPLRQAAHRRGTRIGVEFLLDLLASGWTEAQILDSYPHLKPDDLQAVFAFVRDCLKDESFILELKAAEGQSSR